MPVVGEPIPALEPSASAVPTVSVERIVSMDVLRGVAVLGILLMNIIGFALPFTASFDPTAGGGTTPINLRVWAVNTVLFEGKMRAIFSMLFGAGVLVLTSRLERRAAGDAADICYRRLLWLIAFGLVHAYFIWWGDILFFYGVLGLFLFPLRRLSGRTLVAAGVTLLLIQQVQHGVEALHLRSLRAASVATDAIVAAGGSLTEEQKKAREAWTERWNGSRPSAQGLEAETAAYRGGFGDVLRQRAGFSARMQPSALYHYFVFDIGGMMLLGMGLFKWGVFSGTRTIREYAAIAAIGLAAGLPLAGLAVGHDLASGFDPATVSTGSVLEGLSRPAMALAIASLVMITYKAGALQFLTSRLGAVGQMAFSNYIAHSVICTTLFYGYGFGLFGYLERYQLYFVVAAIWIVQLIVSPIWLRHFLFGPLEWLWRSLTYVSRQPMRRFQDYGISGLRDSELRDSGLRDSGQRDSGSRDSGLRE